MKLFAHIFFSILLSYLLIGGANAIAIAQENKKNQSNNNPFTS